MGKFPPYLIGEGPDKESDLHCRPGHKREAGNTVLLREADLGLMAQVPALLLCGLGQIIYSMSFLSNCGDDNSTWGFRE